MTIPYFQVDAFVAGRPLSGNPAAVMPLERWLDDDRMQAIAAQNNLSETAFTVPADGDEADYELRWFTPTVEVDLCGHATLAAGHVLLNGGHVLLNGGHVLLKDGRVRFATRSGTLTVTRAGDLLELEMPAFAVEPGELAGLHEALGVSGETFLSRGGNGSAIVLLADEAAVRSVKPDFERLRQIDRLVIVTAPGDEHEVASRVFAAYHGIDEDPVTGAAHAALAPFWAKRLGRASFTALQASRRTGVLRCRVAGDRVILGGGCATVIVGDFQL